MARWQITLDVWMFLLGRWLINKPFSPSYGKLIWPNSLFCCWYTQHLAIQHGSLNTHFKLFDMAHFLKSLASTIVLNTRTEPCLCMQYFSFDYIFSWIIPFEELWKIKSDLSIKTLVHHEESLWQAPRDGRPTPTRRQPSFGQPDYWVHQRQWLRRNRLPSRH